MSLPCCTFLCPPCSHSLPPICACHCKSFFLFLLFLVIRTCQLRYCCHCCHCLHLPSLSHRQYPIATMSSLAGTPTTCCTHPHMGCRHTQATPLLSPSPCLVHLQKKPQISYFPFFPSPLTVQDTSPHTHAGCPFTITTTTTTPLP